MFRDVTLWKKWEPREASAWKFSMAYSTMAWAQEIMDQAMGMPRC